MKQSISELQTSYRFFEDKQNQAYTVGCSIVDPTTCSVSACHGSFTFKSSFSAQQIEKNAGVGE